MHQQEESEVVLIDLYLRVLLADIERRTECREENEEHQKTGYDHGCSAFAAFDTDAIG